MNPKKNSFYTKYLLIVLISSLLPLPVKAQTTELNGRWVCYKKETKEGNDGSDITLNGKPYKCSLTIEFINNHKAFYGVGGNEPEKVDYKLKDDDLFIGNKAFKVERKNSKQLVLLERNTNELATITFRYYLKKE